LLLDTALQTEWLASKHLHFGGSSNMHIARSIIVNVQCRITPILLIEQTCITVDMSLGT
jgi:hypothetical protein